MELAKTPAELEQRAVCVVHYGTWAQRGHHARPRDVYLTPDTRLIRGAANREHADYGTELFPRFKGGVLRIASEVARFLLSAVEPAYYQDCVKYCEAIPEVKKMEISAPDWASLVALGIRSWTERHKDAADVKFGLGTLVALGNYTGGDLCFPQLGLILAYQPGCCVTFRGAELEHFVTDWTGDRIFLTFTNHQSVRNWVDQGARTLVPTPEEVQVKDDDDEIDLDTVPCVEMELDIDEDEKLTDKEIHGSGTWSPERNLPGHQSSSASGNSSASST